MKDFHESKIRYDATLQKAQEELSEHNYQLVKKFVTRQLAEGVSKLTIARYVDILRKFQGWCDTPYDEWEEEDVLLLMAAIQQTDFAESTKNTHRKALKRFIRVMYGIDSPLQNRVKQNRKNGNNKNKLPNYLNEEQIQVLIENAKNLRDKAMIAVGYEAGLRVAELAGLRIRDVKWMNSGGYLRAKISVNGKTGYRQIPIIAWAQLLKRWIDEEHPYMDDNNAFVFCSLSKKTYGQQLGYQIMRRIVVKAGERAGIKTTTNPHILRHSRATILANSFTEAQLCEYFGWAQGSDMPQIYVHLSGRDIDKAVNRYYGLEEEEKQEVELKPQKCPRCQEQAAATDRFCRKCGLILDPRERAKIDMEEKERGPDIMTEILKDSEKREEFKKYLQIVEQIEDSPDLKEKLANLLNG